MRFHSQGLRYLIYFIDVLYRMLLKDEFLGSNTFYFIRADDLIPLLLLLACQSSGTINFGGRV